MGFNESQTPKNFSDILKIAIRKISNQFLLLLIMIAILAIIVLSVIISGQKDLQWLAVMIVFFSFLVIAGMVIYILKKRQP